MKYPEYSLKELPHIVSNLSYLESNQEPFLADDHERPGHHSIVGVDRPGTTVSPPDPGVGGLDLGCQTELAVLEGVVIVRCIISSAWRKKRRREINNNFHFKQRNNQTLLIPVVILFSVLSSI